MEEILLNYGPFAVFILLMLSGVGVPAGEEPIIIAAGILVAQEKLPLLSTVVCAYVGVLLADALWYFLCSHYGTRLLHKRWVKRILHPKRLLQAKHQVERRGAWFVAIARFIPGTRTSAITVAGMLNMPFWKFAIVEAACIAVTVPLQITIGYLIGRGIGDRDMASLVIWIIAIAVLASIVPIVIGWLVQLKRNGDEMPRAKAKWLRRFRTRRTPAQNSTSR